MDTVFWLAQAIGAVGLIFSVLSYHSKTRKDILVRQSAGSSVYFFHYLLLQGWTGAAMECLVVLRNWIFIKKETHAWASDKRWMYFFMALAVASLPFTWQGYISLLPVIGILLGVYTRWYHPPAKIRIYSLIGAVLWLPYNIVVQSVAGTVGGVIIIIAIIFAIAKHDRLTPAEKELGSL